MAAALLRDAAHVSRATLARLTGLSDEAQHGYVAPLDEAVNALSELSLVEEPTEQTIRLHPLVREFAAALIEDRATFAAECAARLDDALGEVAKVEREVRVWGLDAVLADLRLGEELGGEEEASASGGCCARWTGRRTACVAGIRRAIRASSSSRSATSASSWGCPRWRRRPKLRSPPAGRCGCGNGCRRAASPKR